jgi:pathogenesis-related protein 1
MRRHLPVCSFFALAVLLSGSCGAPTDQADSQKTTGVDSALSAFAKEFVDAHNDVRARVSPPSTPPLPAMTWSESLSDVASTWAAGCVFEHSTTPYGENLAVFSANDTSPREVVELWAAEVADYDYDANRCAPQKQCGHYTQVVWRDSSEVGCAATSCDSVVGFGRGRLFVCNYDPPGNYVGEQPY